MTWDQIGGPNCGFFVLKISLGQRGQTPWPLRPEEDSCRRPRETEGRAPGKEDLPYYLSCPALGPLVGGDVGSEFLIIRSIASTGWTVV